MKKLAVLLALLPLFLYPSGFWICEMLFKDDIIKWRLLRDTLKGVEVFCLCALYLLPSNRISKAAMYALFILCSGNLWDRLIFKISIFVWTDYVLIGLALVVFVIKLKGREDIFRRSNKPDH